MRGPRPAASSSHRAGGRGRLAAELLIYNLVLLALSPVLAAWLLWRMSVRRKSLGSLRHRIGLIPRAPKSGWPRLWLHAVSAGEMAALRPVLEALRGAFPQAYILVSTVTPAGMTVARRSCTAADDICYLPFDGPGCMGRAMWRQRPALVVVAEKELWPNLLGLARLCGARVLTINGRVSDRVMRRAHWAGGFVRWLYRLPDVLCVQSEQDSRRLQELGVPARRIALAGNTKADNMAARDPRTEERLADDIGAREGEVWLVAGSTHQGEEELVAEAFRLVTERLPTARLLLAPRHLERVLSVSAMLAERGMSVVRRTERKPAPPGGVVLLDTMGELQSAYALGAAGFVGGTLVPVGGHNLLEPLASGRAVIFGPHTANCADVADLVREAGVGFQVSGAAELAERFLAIAADAELQAALARASAALIESQRGASARCAAAARDLLGEVGN